LINLYHKKAGVAQLVERQLPKLKAAGSRPVTRSVFFGVILIASLSLHQNRLINKTSPGFSQKKTACFNGCF
jgi:hypothetical protein